MDVTIQIPDDIAAQLNAGGSELSRRALGAFWNFYRPQPFAYVVKTLVLICTARQKAQEKTA